MDDPHTRQSDAPDVELLKTPDETAAPPMRPRRTGLWIAAAGLLVAGAAATYIVVRGPTPASVAEAPKTTTAAPRTTQPLGGVADNVLVPPLDDSDPIVRQLVTQLSSHPGIAAWLATGGLIRGFTAVVTNIAEGATPAAQLQVLRPAAKFSVLDRGGALYIDPRSYERYDAVAGAAPSIDPAGAARVYSTLKPRIEEAYRDLGAPDGTFDRALERAIVALLETPVVDGLIRVEPQGAGYRFAAAELEALTPAQKQLLRTGPGNVRRIQASLRRIALALGIPPERLPAPRN